MTSGKNETPLPLKPAASDLEPYKDRAITFPSSYLPELKGLIDEFSEKFSVIQDLEIYETIAAQGLAKKLYEDCFRYPDKNFYLKYETEVSKADNDFSKAGLEMNEKLTSLLAEHFREKPVGSTVQGWDPKRSKLKLTDLWRYYIDHYQEIFRKYGVRVMGNFYYPPGGYREWHTNGGLNGGWRMYYIRVPEVGRSWFHYLNPVTDELVKVPDKDDHFHMFYITDMFEIKKKVRRDFFWHNVVSHTHRRSLGLGISQRMAGKIIKQFEESS